MIKIGNSQKPFIIAELSGNHNGSFKNAIKLVRSAARCKVDAVKIQTYTADTMTLNSKKKYFVINNKSSIWHGYKLYNLYKKAHTPWSWHKKIFQEAKRHNLICFSSPFDETAINFLKRFNPPIYKIASFENTDLRLIKLAAKTKKILIISLGLATLSQIKKAVNTARRNGCKKLILLKCTSDYPARNSDINLSTIPILKKKFKCDIGLSDHTISLGAAIAAIGKGACVIEKHFKLSNVKSVDSKFSLDEKQMKLFVKEIHNAWESIGKVSFGPANNEKKNLQFRRSIYTTKKIKKGESFSVKNIKCVRPGYGLDTIHFDKILNKKSKKNINEAEPLTWSHISKK
jgi:pseudaminic acid synthase